MNLSRGVMLCDPLRVLDSGPVLTYCSPAGPTFRIRPARCPAWRLCAEFALRNHAAIRVEVFIDGFNGLGNLVGVPFRQDMLPVNLTPKGDSAAESFAEFFDAHAEYLAVYGINAQFDQIGKYIEYVAVGM